VAGTLNNIGLHLMDEAGDPDRGEAFLRLARSLYGHLKHPEPGHPEYQLAQCLSEGEQSGRVLPWAEAASQLAQAPALRGSALHTLAMTRLRVGDAAGAEAAFREALSALRQSDEMDQRANALYNFARQLCTWRRWEEARPLLVEALEAERHDSGDGEELWTVYSALVEVCALLQDTSALHQYAQEWLESLQRAGGEADLKRALERLDKKLKEAGHPTQRYEAWATLAHRVRSPDVQHAFARCARELGHLQEAEATWKAALRDEDDGSTRALMARELARLYVDTGRPDRALTLARELRDTGLEVLARARRLEEKPLKAEALWALIRSASPQAPAAQDDEA
jgi:tetratricopeptide (TPR) repeat protein